MVMTKLKSLSVLLVFSVFCSLVAAQTESPESLFQAGTQFYVAKDYKRAQESFVKSLDQDPHNATALTNLALTEFQLGNKALAVGLLRKSLAIDPELTTTNTALKFVLSQMQIREVPHQIEAYENLRAHLLLPVPLSAYLILSALALFSGGWVLLSYGGRRKRALENESALPSFPVIGALLTLGFIAFSVLSGLKIYDSSVMRGTIVDEKVSLQTAPGDNSVAILDLYGGMEIIAHKTEGDWIQITYPGSLTGWIKKSSLVMTR